MTATSIPRTDNIHCTIMRRINVLRAMVEDDDPDRFFHGRWKTRAGEKTDGLVYAKGFLYGGADCYGYEKIWDSDQELLLLVEEFLMLIEKACKKKGIKMPEEKPKERQGIKLGWDYDSSAPLFKDIRATALVDRPVAPLVTVKDVERHLAVAEDRISALVYDCEIKKSPLPRKPEDFVSGIKYCKDWEDLENMGIACICAYDYLDDRYRVFMDDNIAEFEKLLRNRKFLVGYNSDRFDNLLLEANSVSIKNRGPIKPEGQASLFADGSTEIKSYDILAEIWRSMGLDPRIFNPRTHGGTGLDVVAKANLGRGKIGNGANAAVLWQQGKKGEIVNYCLDDTMLTKSLFDLILKNGTLKNPKKTGDAILKLRKPEEIL